MHLGRSLSSLMIGGSLGCLAATPAQSQSILFNNFGANNTYDLGTTWRVTGTHVFSGNDPLASKTALAFTPTGSDYTLQTIEVVVGLFDNNSPNELEIALMTNVNGVPGTVIESFHKSGAMSTQVPLVTHPPLQFNSVTHPLLRAGTSYFITAFPGTEDTYAGWNWALGGSQGLVATNNPSTGNVWFSQVRRAPVMRVTGMPVSAAVPEPTALVMGGSGVLGLIGLRRRRRYAAPNGE